MELEERLPACILEGVLPPWMFGDLADRLNRWLQAGGQPVKLRCGKCGRMLDGLRPDWHAGIRATRAVAPAARDPRDHQPARLRAKVAAGETMPVSRPTVAHDPDPWAGHITWTCHPGRCGARHEMRPERLIRAAVAAWEAGRRDLTAGVDC